MESVTFWANMFCYTVMPFGLKNAYATYQRTMITSFRDYLWKTVECYVDDIAVKNWRKDNHLQDLRTIFDLMQAHQLKMNPTKSFLRVSSGKFLGFIVTSKGIYLDLDKINTIQDMQPPRNLKELRGLQGRLTYIWKSIVNLSARCWPFTWLMKKGVFSSGMTSARRPLRISNNTSRSPQSLYLLCEENLSYSIIELWTIF